MYKQRKLSSWFKQWNSDLRKFLIVRGAHWNDLDDIAQEVFLRLLRYDRAELVEHPKAYLFRMAANLATEWAIRARSRHPHDAKWLADLTAEDTPHRAAAEAAVHKEVERAINTLAPRQRLVLKLHIDEGVSVVEIAARLGCTVRVVRRDLAKSYARLRAELHVELIGVLGHGTD